MNSFEHAFDGLPATQPNLIDSQPTRFTFSGRGRDYLSLWLTNWILTIATLGIYSAWAKVRRLQYTHQNTQLGGYAFNFHGSAKSILFGRVIAIILLFMANLSGIFHETASLVSISSAFSLVLSFAYPWFTHSSMRFYERNSSYRNLRFKFNGDLGELYIIYIIGGLLTLFTMGLGFPYLAYRLRRYRVENSHWGRNKFNFTASKGSFFGIYFLHFIITIAVYIGLIALFIGLGGDKLDAFKELGSLNDDTGLSDQQMWALLFITVFAFLFSLIYKVTTSITQDLLFKVSWNHTLLEKSRFACDLNILKLYAIRLGCFALSFLTLGLFTPFAQMLILKQRLQSLTFHPGEDFDLLQANLDADTTRTAEVAEMMDFDISW
ncbi:MAG: YjgN family protein [Formosimonas sp.]